MGYAQVNDNYVELNLLKVLKQFQTFCNVLNKYEILEDNFVLDLTFV